MQDATIPRHKTAIRRGDFSRPIKCLIRDGLLDKAATLFDYGCGRGEDLDLLSAEGFACSGWDPAYRPDVAPQQADVVNLSYVINVIENSDERAATLRQAWDLCRQMLVVSAQVILYGRGKEPVEFMDGVLTGRGTFQKFYEQHELKAYLEAQLQTEAIPASLGVFYLFKDEARRQQFLANRFRRRELLPRRTLTERQFEDSRDLLDPFLACTTSLGRVPEADECPQASALIERFGSLKRAFGLVVRVTGTAAWEAIARRRREDLLVYLALSRFRRRPSLGQLPLTLQRDLRAHFGSYRKACAEADERLFQARNADAVDAACKRSRIGKLLPDDLYVHQSAVDKLEPLLRIYEGCGRAYLGEIEGANIIKFHRRSGKLSYLVYADFEADPHPLLVRGVRLSLRTRELRFLDYSESANPPILHRKESFLDPDHPLHGKFAKLTRQEEAHGLLLDTATIGTRAGWQVRLAAAGFTLRGHRLVRCRPTP